MATVNRVDPDSTVYLLREILAELRSMNPYRLSRPQPEGDEPVEVQDPNQTQLPLDAAANLASRQEQTSALAEVNQHDSSGGALADGPAYDPGASGGSAAPTELPVQASMSQGGFANHQMGGTADSQDPKEKHGPGSTAGDETEPAA